MAGAVGPNDRNTILRPGKASNGPRDRKRFRFSPVIGLVSARFIRFKPLHDLALPHRHRRSRGFRKGHAGAAACRLLSPQPARHRADLSRGGACADRRTGCRSTMCRRPRRRPGRSICRVSTARCCRRMRWRMRPRRSRSIPSVRRILVEKQRAFARTAPGAVLDGRDIGTVVCPDADVKLYVTASAAVRARRRLRDIEGRGGTAEFARNPGRHRAARRARPGPRRLAAAARRRRALDRYVGNVYRSRVSGSQIHRRWRDGQQRQVLKPFRLRAFRCLRRKADPEVSGQTAA